MCETSSRIKITPEMLSYISALKKGTNSFKQEDLYIELEEGDDVLVLKVTESFVEKALTCLIGKVSTYSVRLKKENFPFTIIQNDLANYYNRRISTDIYRYTRSQ